MPITAANLKFQDYKFSTVTSTGTWSWTTRMDVSGAGVVFQVLDIVTPFGILRDSVALPGGVVQDMSATIDQLLANFPPTIFLGPPSSLVFEVDEGRGFSESQEVAISNNGVFGSLLNAQLTTSADYVTTTPAQVGNLSSNEAGAFAVAVDSTTLLSGASPYNETVTAQDGAATNSPQVYNITINVRPKAVIDLSTPQINFSVTKPLIGSFPPIPAQSFTLTNTGPTDSVLEYQVQRLTNLSNDWLQDFSPSSGTLVSAASQIINVMLVPIDSLPIGVYTESLRVSGYSTNSFVDLVVQLTIT